MHLPFGKHFGTHPKVAEKVQFARLVSHHYFQLVSSSVTFDRMQNVFVEI